MFRESGGHRLTERMKAQSEAGGAHSLPHASALLELHVTEYNALTTRNNSWTTIQVGIWSLILLYVTVASTIYVYNWRPESHFRTYVFWCSGVIIQLSIAVLNFTIQEIYRNVPYIETVLRSSIQLLVGDSRFWQYESFLAKKSDKKPGRTDAAATGAVVGAVIVAGAARHVYSDRYELCGFLANLLVCAILVLQTRQTILLRKQFESKLK